MTYFFFIEMEFMFCDLHVSLKGPIVGGYKFDKLSCLS